MELYIVQRADSTRYDVNQPRRSFRVDKRVTLGNPSGSTLTKRVDLT